MGTLVTSLTAAQDLDVGRFGLVNYTLISGDPDRRFKMNSNTGELNAVNGKIYYRCSPNRDYPAQI